MYDDWASASFSDYLKSAVGAGQTVLLLLFAIKGYSRGLEPWPLVLITFTSALLLVATIHIYQNRDELSEFAAVFGFHVIIFLLVFALPLVARRWRGYHEPTDDICVRISSCSRRHRLGPAI
jgi:4-hydroxybenzoate polyprenyltransferase